METTTLSWEDFGLLFLLWSFDGSTRNSFWRFYPEHMLTGEGSCQNLRGFSRNITRKVSPWTKTHSPIQSFFQGFHVESRLTLPPISILFRKAHLEPTWTYFPTELKPGMVLIQPSLGTFPSKSVQWRGKVNSPRVLSLGRARDLLAGNGFKAFWNWKRDLRARWDEMERWEGVKEVSQRRKRGRKRQTKKDEGGWGSLRMCAEFELEIGNRMSAQGESDYRTCVNTIKITAPRSTSLNQFGQTHEAFYPEGWMVDQKQSEESRKNTTWHLEDMKTNTTPVGLTLASVLSASWPNADKCVAYPSLSQNNQKRQLPSAMRKSDV